MRINKNIEIKTIKPVMKECKPFGSGGSHILMSKNDINRNFLVLPESSNYLLDEILTQYSENIKEITNPLLNAILNKEDFNIIKKIYKEEISKCEKKQGLWVNMRKKFLLSDLSDIDIYRVSNIDMILEDIGDLLPKTLFKKLYENYLKKEMII